MVRAEDIYDKKSLRAWLEARPRDVKVLIGSRAALRVLPIFVNYFITGEQAETTLNSSLFLQSYLSPTAGIVFESDTVLGDSIYSELAAGFAAVYAARGAAVFAVEAAARALDIWADGVQKHLWAVLASDAIAIEAGRDLTAIPLWPDENPLAELWRRIEQDGFPPDSPYDFWRRWYQTHLDPATYPPMPPEMLRDIALIDPKIWESTPEDLAKEIARIEAAYEDRPEMAHGVGEGTALAQAKYFDFIEVDKQLRMIGVRADFEDLTEDQIEHFLKDMRDWAQELQDWRDYAQDEVSGNQPSMLLRIVDKLLGHIAKDHSFDDFSARRFMTLGSDLRRVSFDDNQRLLVGDTLAAMLDDRVDQYSKIAAGCFGSAVQALAPLHDLDLDQNDPEVLIEKMRDGLALIRQADPEDLAQLDPESRAVIDEMIRELEELDAAISAAENPKAAQLLRKRFAQRYGGISATVGRSVEKGREVASRAASQFDEAVKWYKRWDRLEKIVDWWNSLGPPPPGL